MALRVVHLGASDLAGGAARAAYRLHQGLRRAGVDSRMVVSEKLGDDPDVHAPGGRLGRARAGLAPYADQVPVQLYPRRVREMFTPATASSGAAARTLALAPDVVHLHWPYKGTLRLEELPRFAPRPVVWTLHDEWPFTGGCHYAGDCTAYLRGCGACPALGSRSRADLSRLVFLRKRRTFARVELTVVTPSRWMAERARGSALLAGRRVEVIPYGIDTALFRPLERAVAREVLGLPPGRTYVLFVAVGGAADRRKGFPELARALALLAPTPLGQRLELLVVGASQVPDLGCAVPVRCLGALGDATSLAIAQAAADLFVAPSLQENLANTVIEALACGRPAVAFRIGGMPDMIVDRENGALAEARDPASLAAAMTFCLEDEARWRGLAARAREVAVRDFTLLRQATRYEALYEDLLARGPAAGRAGAAPVDGGRHSPWVKPGR